MSTSPEPDADRPRQARQFPPQSVRADQNVKLVQRKIDRNLKSYLPGNDGAGDRFVLPGRPHLMAGLARPRPTADDIHPERNGEVRNAPTELLPETSEQGDFLAKAWAERMKKQWEDVTRRLLRDFAPDGGAAEKRVLGHIDEQRQILDDATVRDYLPVLVDRAVRKLLGP